MVSLNEDYSQFFFIFNQVNTMTKNDQILREYVQEKIQEHLETFDANNPKDFIDTFILMTKEEKSDSFSGVNFIVIFA